MIKIIPGDLLYSDCTIIGHQTNCIKQMKSGIAKQIKEMYPEVEVTDNEFMFEDKERLGKCAITMVDDRARYVCNLYGQYSNTRNHDTNYEAFEEALEKMMIAAASLKKFQYFPVKIGLPYLIGCNLGGGDWKKMLPIIRKVAEKYDETIYLYKL
jgi:O-acetyl-ADP-ribose deacetylase (regulator of RNase III)